MALLNRLIKSNQGSLLVEILIVIGLMAAIAPIIVGGLATSRQGEPQQQQRLLANSILKQTQESLRSIREKGWITFAVNGTFHPVVVGNSLSLSPNSDTVNGFTRSVVISDVYRDASGNISTSGEVDLSTKKVIITVSWQDPLPSSVSTLGYYTRYLDNLTYQETTVADFTPGIHVGTTITNTSGGEVIIGTRGRVDWCKPDLSITALDLVGQAYATDISTIEGRAYTTTGGNSSGNSMDKITISGDYPPVAANAGFYNYRKTYAIYATPNYNYLTSDHPGFSVDIVNPNSMVTAGYFLPTGGGKGKGVYISDNIGYVTVDDKLFTFDVSTITGGNQPQLGSVTLAGNAEKVVVKNNFAFVTLSTSSTKLQVIAVSNGGRNLTIVGNSSFNSLAAKNLSVNSDGSRAYITTASSSTQNEVFVVDTSTKPSTAPAVNLPMIGSYDTNGMDPRGIVLVSGPRLIVVGSGGEQYQVINIANDTAPIRCGGLSSPLGATAINAVDTVTEADGDSYAYILTNNANKEFQIIEGGPGGGVGYRGQFTSQIYSASTDTAFNRYEVSATVPANTQISYQFAVAKSVSGSCAGADYVFVGPDGTSSTYYTDTISALPQSSDGAGYENPGSCFRYKVYLVSYDSSLTPIFNNIIVNYSP